MEPRDILRIASRSGLDQISITDHDTIKGSVLARQSCMEFGIKVIIGSEISTDAGHIVGIDLNEDIKCKDWREVLDAIRAQGGLAILAHPYRGGAMTDEVASRCDVLEAFNCRSSPTQNARATSLADALGKPKIAASDAHVWSEVGRARNRCDGVLTSCNVYAGEPARKTEKAFSSVIGDLRRRKLRNLPYHLSLLLR
jgi:hypothetical protein